MAWQPIERRLEPLGVDAGDEELYALWLTARQTIDRNVLARTNANELHRACSGVVDTADMVHRFHHQQETMQ